MSGQSAVRVSVVVPTYRRPELLRRTLTALLAQDFPAEAYEILICDDAASPATEALVDEVCCDVERSWLQGCRWDVPDRSPALVDAPSSSGRGSHGRGSQLPADAQPELVWLEAIALPEVRWIPVTGNHGPAAARNAGWRSARGPVIAFTDDDCLPAPGWLAAGASALERDRMLAGVMGQTLVPLPAAPTDSELMTAGLQRSEFITANCFYRRSALQAAGGFDERFTQAWREDSDLFFTLLDLFGAAAFRREPRSLVIHPARPAPWGATLAQQQRARFNALLYKKHPGHYRGRLAPVTPWHYYAIVGAFVVALAALLAGQPALAASGGLAWSFLTGRFAFRRLRPTSKAPSHVAEMIFTSLVIPFLSLYWRWRGALQYRVLLP